MSEHTPTPWAATEDQWEIFSVAEYKSVAMLLGNGQERANATFIVKACNSHDALMKALEAYEAAIDEAEAIFGGEYADHYGPMFEKAMAARDARRAALQQEASS